MKAIILAGGDPGIKSTPVSNLEIAGKNLLDIQISCIRTCGIEDIVVVTGFKADLVKRADAEIRFNSEWRDTKSAGSLNVAKDLFNGEEDLLVVYGDTLFEPAVIKAALETLEPIVAVCFLDRSNHDIGNFREYAIIENGLIQNVTEDPKLDGVRTVYTGIVVIRSRKTDAFAQYLENQNGHVGNVLGEMSAMGVNIVPEITEHGWAEITSPESLENLMTETDFLERINQVHTDWTKRSEKYNKLQWVNNDVLLSGITDIARTLTPDKVVDVGTGTGKVLFAIKDTLGKGEYWGLDYSQSMLEKIERKDEINLHCVDIESQTELPADYFDLATARMIFHHLNDTVQAARNISNILKPGGTFVLCEGVPPTLRTVDWYTEMFHYKEDRKTLTEVDLINTLLQAGFEDVATRSIVMENCSLNNWLDNSGLPNENIEIIKDMHFNAPDFVQEDYEMEMVNGDCLMRWRFAITWGKRRR